MAERREIRLLRHGRTKYNELGLVGGITDVPLSSYGIRSAEALGREMMLSPETVVFSGRTQRHVDTARLVSQQPQHRIIRTGLLNERNYGVAEKGGLHPKLMKFWWTDHAERREKQPFKGMVKDSYLLLEREIFDARLLQKHPEVPILAVSSEDKLVTWLDHLGIQRLDNLSYVDLAGPKGAPLHRLELVGASEGVLFKAAA